MIVISMEHRDSDDGCLNMSNFTFVMKFMNLRFWLKQRRKVMKIVGIGHWALAFDFSIFIYSLHSNQQYNYYLYIWNCPDWITKRLFKPNFIMDMI